jgi:2-polyprenyl-3-methyl-5-hydroxy-6-metoxy-1,4-benzoquinol methylase
VSDEADRRRADAVSRINAIDRDRLEGEPDRTAFFDTVYDMAEGNAAGVPWADLAPKPELVEWLAANPGEGGRAIDVACGLGDNAEAIAAAGYVTTAFDGAAKAIDWARRRFPRSPVDYRVADLLDAPAQWRGAFDLVHECYTVQSVPPQRHPDFIRAIVDLVAPGGTLLVYTRVRPDGSEVSGPPWPLTETTLGLFAASGLHLVANDRFAFERPGRTVPHAFMVFRRPAEQTTS